MSSELVGASFGALALFVSTVLTVVYGPVLKARTDRRRERMARSEQLIARYSEPLARAAFDLQSRMYNILRLRFLQIYYHQDTYAELSSLWLFGQYFAWVEVLRREVQVLDIGDARSTATLQLRLFAVSDAFASEDVQDNCFAVFRQHQRAIGEIMMVERSVGGLSRSDCMGYAEFQTRLTVPTFLAWFEPLRKGLRELAATEPQPDLPAERRAVRPIVIQRSLIDLVDFLDSERVRFPNVNERGKIPMPLHVSEPKRPTSDYSVARFVYIEADPWALFHAWADGRRAVVTDVNCSTEIDVKRACIAGTWFRPSLEVVQTYDQSRRLPRIEICANATVTGPMRHVRPRPLVLLPPGRALRLWLRNPRSDVNELLQRFDRPVLK
jgi:hypothetical protein